LPPLVPSGTLTATPTATRTREAVRSVLLGSSGPCRREVASGSAGSTRPRASSDACGQQSNSPN
jgi:hypothetical protein